jgi:aspartate/methionine/tyrosine aminotransferase
LGHDIRWLSCGLMSTIRRYGMSWVDAERNVTVTCGSTEAMVGSMLAVLDPGDDVVVFEPFYENEVHLTSLKEVVDDRS